MKNSIGKFIFDFSNKINVSKINDNAIMYHIYFKEPIDVRLSLITSRPTSSHIFLI